MRGLSSHEQGGRHEQIRVGEVKEKIRLVSRAVGDTRGSAAAEQIGNLTITALRKPDGTIDISLKYFATKNDTDKRLFKMLNPVAKETQISIETVFPSGRYSFFYPQQTARDLIIKHTTPCLGKTGLGG